MFDCLGYLERLVFENLQESITTTATNTTGTYKHLELEANGLR